ncbi:hypothetical protein Tco_1413050 [Tanacetum coccineum]
MLTAIAGWRWVIGHGFCLAVHKCARSLECRSALGKVISIAINKGIQEGLEAGVVHGRAGRSLTQIEAYDLEVKGKILKDSLFALIMSALTLKDNQGNTDNTPEFARQSAERRGLCPPSSSAPGGTSGSVPPHDASVGIADYQVSTLVLTDDGGTTNPPPVFKSHDDLFDISILDKSGDV